MFAMGWTELTIIGIVTPTAMAPRMFAGVPQS